MRYRELKTFARNYNGAALAPEGIKALELPIPNDVLEQFVIDHGLNEEFQEFYGDLDLSQIAWAKEMISALTISRCSSKYESYILQIRDRYERISSFEECSLTHEAIRSWMDHGTWLRPPVFIFDVLPSPESHHLVEGHTRVGALQGLIKNQHNIANVQKEHLCWIGRPIDLPTHYVKDWKEARRQYPIEYKHWIYAAIEEDSVKGDCARALLNAEYEHRHELLTGNNLSDVQRLLNHDPRIKIDKADLMEFYREWRTQLELDAA